jgi:hypothetical protein
MTHPTANRIKLLHKRCIKLNNSNYARNGGSARRKTAQITGNKTPAYVFCKDNLLN